MEGWVAPACTHGTNKIYKRKNQSILRNMQAVEKEEEE
jgi:hypothetical protein